jgi:hypothetical protein
MNAASCAVSFPAQTLTAYWLGELDGPAEGEFEEHLFGCAGCTARLHALASLGAGVKRLARGGDVHAVLPGSFVERLKALGVRVREYRVRPGGSVMCTVTPDDDLVLAHLHAPLHDVSRLDLVLHDVTQDARTRIEDVAFDPLAGEVVMLPNVSQLRQVAFMTLRVKLLAVEDAAERVIGEYTFNHSPHV